MADWTLLLFALVLELLVLELLELLDLLELLLEVDPLA